MNTSNWKRVETIVDQVLEMPESERKTFIDSKCGDDAELKGEVTQFLQSIYESEGWLEEQDVYRQEMLNEIAEEIEQISAENVFIGKKVGSYTIREKIAEGGMGAVYLAERSDDELDHRVAIKIIQHGRASRENLRRFKREQQILAGMNHPSIARFFDSGTTANGVPYIIMEYIDGMPITDYCEKHQCSTQEKITLFEEVLEAVRYAHENLVIHRDLKPGNIFIDKSGNVKILDFGISKLIEDDSEIITQTGARLLTLRYAAPEQIRQENITTATDLYALGIIFYQLLAGIGPFDIDELSRFETEQVILNEEAPRPSSRMDSPSLKRELYGDLDAIALKSIRKEPDQRYRVANEFLSDLENYKYGLPVSAHADSLKYRSKKFIRRHQKAMYIASGVLTLVILLTAYYTNQIAQQRDFAQLEAERAEEVTNFLISMLELNNPSENSGDEITINDALNRGIQLLEQDNLSALNRATILGTIGSIQFNNGEIEQAGINLQKAMAFVTDSLPRQTEKSLAIGTQYSEWLETVGNMEESDRYFQLTDSLFRVHKLDHSMSYIEHELNYSDYLMEVGRHEQALSVLSDLDNVLVQNFNLNSPDEIDILANVYNNRGRAYKNIGQNQAALDNLEQALTLKLRVFDENNTRIATLYHNMGVVYATVADFPKAYEMTQKAYEIRLKVYSPTHQLVGSSLQALGNIALELGNYEEAYNYIQKSVEINKQQHGATHFRYALALREYAKVLSETGRHDEAREQIAEASSIIENNYGAAHPYFGYMMITYGEVEYNDGEYKKAGEFGEKAITNFQQNFDAQHPNIGRVYAAQGKYALKNEDYEEADSLLKKSVEILKQHYDASNPFLIEADSLLLVNRQLLED
ncbi:serine/threonine-protein kinase [Rhodohalobacter sp. 614A]|uniref:serine/threonine-protein kinase n=1 Tax=Rhodohalobacter sp. 614A TaxID=2908649 RepID=UPI001F445836|nr:serine/threonine-protein kinase [Rhodohalobacter sp. 614A]